MSLQQLNGTPIDPQGIYEPTSHEETHTADGHEEHTTDEHTTDDLEEHVADVQEEHVADVQEEHVTEGHEHAAAVEHVEVEAPAEVYHVDTEQTHEEQSHHLRSSGN